jgi:hypothetical protein
MGPVVTQLMPPFFKDDFLFSDFVASPEIGMGLVQTEIRRFER